MQDADHFERPHKARAKARARWWALSNQGLLFRTTEAIGTAALFKTARFLEQLGLFKQ
jgi:hypothetical protein